ncbi:MAG: RES family NAD+ phosphorylase [Actinomycetia bacterium]|nr:RES family NAD+ phosphorylase [Actinomycetes bacterium]
MIKPETTKLRDAYPWLRVADETWEDPLDPTYAQIHGGRWNPPSSYAALYLNEDIDTARAQIRQMLSGSPVRPEDLDRGYVLVTATIPSRQEVADGITRVGLGSLGLPNTYPLTSSGHSIPHEVCQPIGSDVMQLGLRGVHARSAATRDGSGRELAWFPARRSSRAAPVGAPIPFDEWW